MSTTRTGGTTSPAGAVVPSASAEDRGAVLAAWFGFLFGTAASIGGNVLATWLPKLTGQITDPRWTPGLWPQVGAAVWPVALLVSVEVLTRTSWRAGLQWTIARLVSVVTVALGGAVISYGHLHEVLTAWRYPTAAAGVGPLVIDGLMLISGFALLSISKNRRDRQDATTTAAAETPTAAPVPAARTDQGPAPVPATRTPRAKSGPRRETSAGAAARTQTGRDKARAYWDTEIAKGRVPEAVELSEIAGRDKSLARRWRRDWVTEPAAAALDAAAQPTTTDTNDTDMETTSEGRAA